MRNRVAWGLAVLVVVPLGVWGWTRWSGGAVGGDTVDKKGLDRITGLFQSYADAVKGRNVNAEEAEALRVLQEVTKNPPKATPQSMAREEAHHCERVFDWVGAEKAYRRAIEVGHQPLGKSMTYNSLCALYGLLGRDDEALGAAREAVKLARQDGSSVWTSYSLGVEAGLCLRANDLKSAGSLIEEIFRSIGDGPMNDLSRARTLVLRASYYQKRSDLPKAEADLATAWKILQPHSEVRVLAGWHGALAAWWATTARVRAKQSDLAGAVAAWREAVNRYRRVAEAPQIEGPYKFNSVAVAFNDLGQALQAAGEPKGAEQAFRDSRSIRHTIGLPPLEGSDRPGKEASTGSPAGRSASTR